LGLVKKLACDKAQGAETVELGFLVVASGGLKINHFMVDIPKKKAC
jgi:hypothetical protein